MSNSYKKLSVKFSICRMCLWKSARLCSSSFVQVGVYMVTFYMVTFFQNHRHYIMSYELTSFVSSNAVLYKMNRQVLSHGRVSIKPYGCIQVSLNVMVSLSEL